MGDEEWKKVDYFLSSKLKEALKFFYYDGSGEC